MEPVGEVGETAKETAAPAETAAAPPETAAPAETEPSAPSAPAEPKEPPKPAEKPCRHEYVRIYQRKLKGLDRRLVVTRAFLPVGFKLGDFNHLSPGSFCFCTKCRLRLFPKRTEGEKELARLERKAAKELGIQDLMRAKAASDGFLDDDDDDDDEGGGSSSLYATLLDDKKSAKAQFDDGIDDDKLKLDIHVDELEVESVDVEDIKAEGVKISTEDDFDEPCALPEDEES